MSQLIVVGAQWGDEGKGRIVDWASEDAELVVRYNGGHNAGHTLVVDGRTWKLALLPCGLLHGRTGAIGKGVSLDPQALLDEISRVSAQGLHITPDTLWLAEDINLVLPLHRALDVAQESLRGTPVGTTGRGIGPALEDRSGRRALRLCDLAEPDTLEERLDGLLAWHAPLARALGLPAPERAALLAQLQAWGEALLPFAAPVGERLAAAHTRGAHILYEGAQAMMLDTDHGTWPYVTGASTLPAQAAPGSGFGAAARARVLGVVKAYSSRVGNGPFPSEMHGAAGDALRERGGEYGVNTGRPRRCGWIDLALLRQTARLGALDALAVTKLDVLDDQPEISVCTGYRIGGRLHESLPPGIAAQAAAEPVYETLPGWQCDTGRSRRLEDLPMQARKYLERIEAFVGVPIALVSVGAEREALIAPQGAFDL
ncbi:adenylosuccinate synthase [Niveibacterium sp. SC-1]|uniref:adenylosuccinate synthase n=1 Tax=Niveibacterium sp. SC-1 TaxID=3135646 RepID=UPI00311E7DEF